MMSAWADWIVVGLGLLIPAVAGWIFSRWSEPLREFKRIWKGNPILGIIASAVVMAVEMIWSEYDGAYQFDRACELLAEMVRRFGIGVNKEQVREIVQTAYETLKRILGEQWGALKLGLILP